MSGVYDYSEYDMDGWIIPEATPDFEKLLMDEDDIAHRTTCTDFNCPECDYSPLTEVKMPPTLKLEFESLLLEEEEIQLKGRIADLQMKLNSLQNKRALLQSARQSLIRLGYKPGQTFEL